MAHPRPGFFSFKGSVGSGTLARIIHDERGCDGGSLTDCFPFSIRGGLVDFDGNPGRVSSALGSCPPNPSTLAALGLAKPSMLRCHAGEGRRPEGEEEGLRRSRELAGSARARLARSIVWLGAPHELCGLGALSIVSTDGGDHV
jgi:hypothetical protein